MLTKEFKDRQYLSAPLINTGVEQLKSLCNVSLSVCSHPSFLDDLTDIEKSVIENYNEDLKEFIQLLDAFNVMYKETTDKLLKL